jgi:putative hemolysin
MTQTADRNRRARTLETRLARDARDLRAAQRLRYRVFVQELGASGPMVDHDAKLERDAFDAHFDHLLLIDTARDAGALDDVVGAYRLLPGERAASLGTFYGDSEYDLSAIKTCGRRVVELGRTCVHPDYRGGVGMLHLWNALAEYVLSRDIEIMFGVASFHGTDVARLAPALAWLHHNRLAPPELRVRALAHHHQPMDLIPADQIDEKQAMDLTPPLIRAYLRLGGFVGEGAFVDHEFNTTDVCLIMDTAAMSEKHRDFYTRKTPRA